MPEHAASPPSTCSLITPGSSPPDSPARTMTPVTSEPSLSASTALEFLARDHRPTLMLHLHQTLMVPPHHLNPPRTIYSILFANDAFLACTDLNAPGIHQSFAEMQPCCVCIGRWMLEITRIGDVQVITAFRSCWERRMRAGESGAEGEVVKVGVEEVHIDCETEHPSVEDVEEREERQIIQEDKQLAELADALRDDDTKDIELPKLPTAGDDTSEMCPIGGSSVCTGTCANRQVEKVAPALPPPMPRDRTQQRSQKTIKDWRMEPKTEAERQNESQHFRSLRQVDWGKTAYGPMESWSTSLRTVALSMMYSPLPIALYWGPNYDTMYNEGWKRIARERDPEMLGQPFEKYWPELWSYFKPLLDDNYYEGINTRRDCQQLMFSKTAINGPGTEEECYFDLTMFPIMGDSRTPEGVIEFAVERTGDVITKRRLETLRRLSNSLRVIQNFDDQFWGRLVTAFDDNPYDSPILIVYRTASVADDSVQHLQQAIGVSRGGQFAPYMCFVDTGSTARGCGLFNEEMRIAKAQNIVVMKHLSPDSRALDEISTRGFREVPCMAAVIPIQVNKKSTCGFMILGLNSKRPFDQGYSQWLESIRKELAVSAGSVWMRQQEFSRAMERERQGAIKQLTIDLKEQLSRRTEALRRSELMFTQTAETLPVGVCLADNDGFVFYSNNAARKMFSVKSDREMNDCWKIRIYHEDRSRAVDAFEGAVRTKCNSYQEYRVNSEHDDPSIPEGQDWKYWVACSTLAQVDEFTGEVSRFMVALVDITSHKQNEEYQRQLSTQALERRRQQENFIDIFSHELRNPFSATLQCADSILTSLAAYQSKEAPLDTEEVIDSAQTILVCVQHQMRIIDDVLTLSKLESMALTVVPTHLKVHDSVAQMLKLFASELLAKGITAHYIVEDSYRDLHVEWAMADPSRFSQILVNLLTNSIKFTSLQSGKREISVRLAVSKTRPDSHGAVVYHTSTSEEPPGDTTASEDWGTGEPLYIQVMVADTGIGISTAWQSKLFRRFEQVPKTHVTYGGSGLGLFICRRLCHVQGGEIGFTSVEGQGSCFAFFIKVRRSSGPAPSTSTSPAATATSTPSTAPASSAVVAAPTRPSPTAYRVLIVEDNLINQEVLRRQLKNGGCVTHVANNGQQALDFVCASAFASPSETPLDLVLMDMEMPVMDGNTATRAIRALQKSGKLTRHVPIMGISANARPEQVALMTEAGMDDAIPKPFRIPELIGRFDKMMQRLQTEGVIAPEGTREAAAPGTVLGVGVGEADDDAMRRAERAVEGEVEKGLGETSLPRSLGGLGGRVTAMVPRSAGVKRPPVYKVASGTRSPLLSPALGPAAGKA